MLVPKRQSAIQRSLLLLAVVVIFALIGYLIYNRFFTDTASVDSVNPAVKQSFSNIVTDFSYDFIKLHPYIDLQQNAQLPVVAGEVGHNNPFSRPPFTLTTR